MQVGSLLLVIALTYGPVVGLMALLNLRDRRESAVLGVVLKQLASRDLLGRIAIRIRCALLSPRSVVAIDMRACSRDEIWEAVRRLCQGLPPPARLVVDGRVDPQLPATVTVEATSSPPLCHPRRPSVASG
ncbi:MAG: hypothetical protein ACREJF_00955 [Candidatus Methylomirabilales bacterium]